MERWLGLALAWLAVVCVLLSLAQDTGVTATPALPVGADWLDHGQNLRPPCPKRSWPQEALDSIKFVPDRSNLSLSTLCS
jgi:hypothetical protein